MSGRRLFFFTLLAACITLLSGSFFANEVSAEWFCPYVTYSTGSWPEAVAIGDVNNDGRNDVVLSTSEYFDPVNDYCIHVFLQNADGGLLPRVRYPVTNGTCDSVDIGDVNNDGLVDVVVSLTNGVGVFHQNTYGTLDPMVTYLSTGSQSNKLRIGDFNNDGLQDVVSIGSTSSSADVYLQDGNGALASPISYSIASPGFGSDLDVGDVNGDGRDDIIVMKGQGVVDPIGVLLQNSTGTLDPVAYYDIPLDVPTKGVAAGDVNGDLLEDVVVSYGGMSPNSQIGIFYQNAGGTLASPVSFSSYHYPGPVEVGDIDGDGLNDFVVAHGSYVRMGLYLQSGGGFLAEDLYPIPYASSYNPHGIAVGDINGNGQNDVAIADYNSGLVLLYDIKPTIAVSSDSLSNECGMGEDAPNQTFDVWNSTDEELSYSITDDVAWLSCSPESGTSVGEHDTITITYSTAGLAPGTYTGTITITSSYAMNSPQTITVTMEVGAAISTSPTSLSAYCPQGQDAPSSTFDVWNSGPGTLSYTISDDADWLSCAPSSGTSAGETDTITVTYATSGLANGTYSAVITIDDPNAYNNPQTIPVTLTVGAMISLSTDLLGPTCMVGENATNSSFEVCNSGSGNLNYSISDDAEWLSCSPSNGTSTGEHDTITVVYSTAGLAAGDYSATILTTDPLAVNNPQSITVNLTVRGPTIWVSPSTISTSCGEGESTSANFYIKNTGYGTLSYTISDDANWLSCSPTTGTSIGETDIVAVNFHTFGMGWSLEPGTYAATITASDPTASNNPRTIAVTFTVIGPAIARSPSTLSPTCLVGQDASSQTFTVRNSAYGTLSYSISDDAIWLSCNPTTGTSTGETDTITVTYSTSGLSAGNYSATITITDPNASNDPQTVLVNLSVTQPAIGRSPDSLTNGCTAGQNAPGQAFEIWNSGTGTLSYAISDDATWLYCNPSSGVSTGEHDVVSVIYNTASLAPGNYSAVITITDPAALNNPQTISVDLAVLALDSDGDGIPDDGDNSGTAGDNRCIGGATTDCDDNCVNDHNPLQEDPDSDGVGTACDNCPSVYNPGQTDTDGDDIGEACDICPNDPDNDIDGDGVCGDIDNCPAMPNAGQEDCNLNGLGDACDSINPLADDSVCDGVDNNCNGIPDDQYVPPPTSCGEGVCVSSGQLECVDGTLQDTCTPGSPTGLDDDCDGLDQNCNGIPDDAYIPTATSCGVGECGASGQLNCVDGTLEDTCTPGSPTGADDECDGLDQNCNGTADENYTPTPSTCGVGVCEASGQLSCIDGVLEDTCTPGSPTGMDDDCDGLDQNCNGIPDDAYVSTPTSCGTGECGSSGEMACVAGALQDTCTPGSPTGLDDDCDGLDQNCNGIPDDAYIPTATSCGVGECGASGQLNCVEGTLQDTCTPGSPTGLDDECDGLDQDCDGVADNNYLPTPTNCGIGECAATGSLDCVGGALQDTCAPGSPTGLDDDCDGLDQNCNGIPDDAYIPTATSCGVGECGASGQLNCVDNTLEDTCTPGSPTGADDECDGLDQNCNGIPDDAYVPTATNCGIGECVSAGQLECVGGVLEDTCTPGSPTGADDECDGLDQNCNGVPDDAYVPTVTSCGTGECASAGQLECVEGVLEDTCTPGSPTGADDECDGLDQNCNGIADENYIPTPTSCGVGACETSGQMICSDGTLTDTCTPGSPTGADDDCDGLDQNCNGIPDDAYVPTVTSCGVGECDASGQLNCVDGTLQDTCTPGSPTGLDNECDGLDQDCDGVADNNYLPTPTNCGIGECAATGSLDCVGGTLVDTCLPGLPTDEICDGLDNNCNSAIDDGLQFLTYYQDADGDQYGNASMSTDACSLPPGYVADSTDCNDADELVNPGMAEASCNDIDDDCNPVTPDDVTPPEISCPGDTQADYECGGTPIGNPAIQDFLQSADAVDDCDGPVPVTNDAPAVFPVGATAVTFGATDIDGNPASCQASVHVNYQYSGIQQPINADDSSVFPIGKCVPIRFALSCSGTTPVDTAAATLSVTKISDTMTGTILETEVIPPGLADSGNLFRYVETEQRYEYNWLTKYETEGTYQITISLDDGTIYEAVFSLSRK